MTELEKALEQLKGFLEEAGYEEAEYLMTMSDEELDELFRRFKRDVRKKERAYSPNSNEYKSLNEQRALVERIEKMLRDREKENSGLMLSGAAEESDTDSEVDDFESDEEEFDEEEEFEDDEEEEWNTAAYQMEQEKQAKKRAREKLKRDLEDKYNQYMTYKDDKSLRAMEERKRIYKEVAELAKTDGAYVNLLAIFEDESKSSNRRIMHLLEQASEMGNGAAANNLSKFYRMGIRVPKNMQKSRAYLDLAVERDSTSAILRKALELAISNMNDYAYEKDEEAAFSLFKRYIELRTPLDMLNSDDRKALYYYYLFGARCGHDMEKEAVSESWEILLDGDDDYAKKAKRLPAIILQGQGRYEEVVQLLIDEGTESAMEKVEDLFFHEYFTSRPELQRNLENYLLQMRDSEEMISEVREELYEWYGWRYETGKDMIKDTAIAYAYYGKAAALGGWEKYQNYKNRILKDLSTSDRIVFFKNVMAQGYFEVAKEIAELYEEKYLFEDAKEYYQQGSEYATDRAVKQQCREGYTRCKERIDKRMAQIEAATPSFNQCNTSLIGQKKEGFTRLRAMAKNGNTYAALRFAQIAEADNYLKETMSDFPTNEEIFECYKAAAKAGERDAISRMVDILEYGQLGQLKAEFAGNWWRNKL